MDTSSLQEGRRSLHSSPALTPGTPRCPRLEICIRKGLMLQMELGVNRCQGARPDQGESSGAKAAVSAWGCAVLSPPRRVWMRVVCLEVTLGSPSKGRRGVKRRRGSKPLGRFPDPNFSQSRRYPPCLLPAPAPRAAGTSPKLSSPSKTPEQLRPASSSSLSIPVFQCLDQPEVGLWDKPAESPRVWLTRSTAYLPPAAPGPAPRMVY